MSIERFVQVETGLRRSKLVDRIVADTGADTATVVGCLVLLWSAALDARTRGDLSERSDRWIEDEAGWLGMRGAFAAAVRAHHLDERGVIRDFNEKYGKLDVNRSKATGWKRGQRARSSGQGEDGPVDVASVSSGQVEDVRQISSYSPSSSLSALEQDQEQGLENSNGRERPDPLDAVLAEAKLDLSDFGEYDVKFIRNWLRSLRAPYAAAAILRAQLEEEKCSPKVLAVAVREYAGLGSDRIESRHFAGFVRRAKGHVEQAPARAMGRMEEKFITAEDREAENAKREEAEAERTIKAFERDDPDMAAALMREAEIAVDPHFKGMFRAPVVRAKYLAMIRQHTAEVQRAG